MSTVKCTDRRHRGDLHGGAAGQRHRLVNTNAELSIGSVTSGTGGTAVLNLDGSVTFTPNANFNKAADFTYTVTDGTDTSNTATVTVNMAAVNDAPAIGVPSKPDVTEDAPNSAAVTLTATGTISITDADAGEGYFHTTVSGIPGNSAASIYRPTAATHTRSPTARFSISIREIRTLIHSP